MDARIARLPELAAFQDTVKGTHLEKRWIDQFRRTIEFCREHPAYMELIGVIPYENNAILMNAANLSAFLGLQRNSLNCNLGQHGFAKDTQCNVRQELTVFCPSLAPRGRS
jgi:hypothetical protein